MASYKILSICSRPELQKLPSNIDRAVFIFLNLMEIENLSRNDLYQYFKITPGVLQRASWNVLLGFNGNTFKETRYLSPSKEMHLQKIIAAKTNAHESTPPQTVARLVFLFLMFLVSTNDVKYLGTRIKTRGCRFCNDSD